MSAVHLFIIIITNNLQPHRPVAQFSEHNFVRATKNNAEIRDQSKSVEHIPLQTRQHVNPRL